ncbi:hypothetical protein DV515_00015206 [Chloebia gouldiae]|uniref:Uncharacterized protein n=1 Tax=Chloebia gouldiae TaxID=44316 RepID=A0A3L8RW07_CHLGU|nr:hypothetical protein DV515_00015206 [Chloebia gouldiae]
MVLLLFNIDASAGQLLGKLAFLSGGKDGCVICEGDVSEKPRRDGFFRSSSCTKHKALLIGDPRVAEGFEAPGFGV